jgi:acyl transferase domain-containing protein
MNVPGTWIGPKLCCVDSGERVHKGRSEIKADRGVKRMQSSDIAVIGMACRFPGAPDPAAFWSNVHAGVCSISEHPAPGMDAIVDPESPDFERVYTTRGGYLRELATFDPLAFGMIPNAVQGSDPSQLLALEVGRAALEDAGLLDADFDRRRADVILGYCVHLHAANTNWLQHGVVLDQTMDLLGRLAPNLTDAARDELRGRLRAALPPMDLQAIASVSGNIVAGRIANRLDLMGACYTVDAACASSLLALDQGATNLALGRCDVALVGGVYGHLSAPMLMLFCRLGALSRSAAPRPFGKDADGTLLAEGLGMVVLKRLSDAMRDGHRIYAVLKGVGTASDGRGAGLLAPRADGEQLAIRRAYRHAGVDPATVGLIEAHGTGIPLGDRTEFAALRHVFGSGERDEARCALGSVKSLIGHTISAAGIAGVIKATLSLHHRVLPPTRFGDEVDPELDVRSSPFYLCRSARPWIHGLPTPRRAGVSAMGFGGINAHCVLEEAPA